MRKHIASTDPRKPLIVAQLKILTGANKVTEVYEVDDGYTGTCMKYVGGKYETIGRPVVPRNLIEPKSFKRPQEE